MRQAVIVAAAAFLLVLSVSASIAQPYMQQTAADSVLIDGVYYPRVTFSIWNFGNAMDLVVANRLASTGPQDTCRVIRALGPWVGSIDPNTGSVLWLRPSPSGPAPDAFIPGFQVVVTRGVAPCYRFNFSGVLPEPFAFEDACIGAELPVAVAGRTWGALKARYR
jgi:hypothetical protein